MNIKKMTTVTDLEFKKEFEAKWGSFNDFPEQWVEVTNDLEQVGAIHYYHLNNDWEYSEYRQMYFRPSHYYDNFVSATLYFTNKNNGYAIGRIWENNSWMLKYYRFGCQHQSFTVKSRGRCWATYCCDACGYNWFIDSSD